ncbi:hypothetical protein ACNOYE_26070 [Nannocystaceae bacterium ST9]
MPKRLIACLLLMAACGSPPAPSGANSNTQADSGPSDARPEAPACSTARIEPELALYCDFEAQVPTNELPSVRWSGPAFHLLDQRLVIVDAQGLVLVAGEVTRKPIATWLAEPAPTLAPAGPLVLAIADALPASQARELFVGLHASARADIQVLVRSEDPEQALPVPRQAEMLAEIGRRLAGDLHQRAMQLAMTMREYTQTCPALATALQNLAALAPEERCVGMASAVARAIVDCRCEQVDEITTVLYAISVGTVAPKGRVVAVPLTLDPGAAVKPASTATWGELAGSQLTSSAAHRIWLAE